MKFLIVAVVAALGSIVPAHAQDGDGASRMVPNANESNPQITRTPPSVRTGSGVPGSDIPAINPSYPKRLQDYSNPVFRSQPYNRTPGIRRR
ncbi:MAG TPA: hypothetical protein VM620_07320 [Hyphomicrobium sp.]|jgi:hypothetical protein|nr:hypothetical protein [Hyphomicrobium sp.]